MYHGEGGTVCTCERLAGDVAAMCGSERSGGFARPIGERSKAYVDVHDGGRTVRGSFGRTSTRRRIVRDTAGVDGSTTVTDCMRAIWSIWLPRTGDTFAAAIEDDVVDEILPGVFLHVNTGIDWHCDCRSYEWSESNYGQGFGESVGCKTPSLGCVSVDATNWQPRASDTLETAVFMAVTSAMYARFGLVNKDARVFVNLPASFQAAAVIAGAIHSAKFHVHLEVFRPHGLRPCECMTQRGFTYVGGMRPYICNLHVLARSSRNADVEVNPGPVSDVESLTSSDSGGELVLWSSPEPAEEWSFDAERNRTMSWLGGTRHQADVQAFIALAGIPQSRATILMQEYVASSARATYYNSSGRRPIVPTGVSDHAVADAFKASYIGRFRADYMQWLSERLPVVVDRTNRTSLVLDYLERDFAQYDKTLCEGCGFFVNASGHEYRCRRPDVVPAGDRRAAWLGDALHVMDVRRILIKADVRDEALQVVCGKFVSAESQAHYMRSRGLATRAESNRVVSTRFEAEYVHALRHAYLVHLVEVVNRMFSATIPSSMVDAMVEETHVAM